MTSLIIRTLIIYFSLLLTMRLLGKRQLGEMELSEFVVAALIADIAAIPLQDTSLPIYRGLIPISVLYCCELLISILSLKSIRLRSFLFGKPSILVSSGKINQHEMRKNRFTCDELMQELRGQGIIDISEIQYAILETNGKLNIITTPDSSPVTASQMGIKTERIDYPFVIISDGRIISENLEKLGRDEKWLQKQFKTKHITSPKEVFLMTADLSDKIFWALKE